MSKKAFLLVALTGLLVGAAAAHLVTYMYPGQFSMTTETSSLVLYIDGAKHGNLTTIDWGSFTRAEGETVTYYYLAEVLNNGTTPLTVYLMVENEPTGVTHTWTPNGTLLDPTEIASADLEITVTPACPDGTYSAFTYYLYGD